MQQRIRSTLLKHFSFVVVLVLIPLLMSALAESKDSFKPGQIWTYITRTNESNSRLTILKIETIEKIGEVIHIRIDGVKIKNPHTKSGLSTELPHLPFSSKALRADVKQLVEETKLIPDFKQGYDEWKKAKGGVFTTSVAETITFVEQTLNTDQNK